MTTEKLEESSYANTSKKNLTINADKNPNKKLNFTKNTNRKCITEEQPVDQSSIEKDNSFWQFRKICGKIASESSHNLKTEILHNFITKGGNGVNFHGDMFILLKLLLPGVIKTIYNLHDKQLVKLFSQIFKVDYEEMISHSECGDVSETIFTYFQQSKSVKSLGKSILSIQQVDSMLNKLSQFTKEDDQQNCLEEIAEKCTSKDLKMIVRLIKHDLKINSGSKIILDALDSNAYTAFRSSHDLSNVVDRVLKNQTKISTEAFGNTKEEEDKFDKIIDNNNDDNSVKKLKNKSPVKHSLGSKKLSVEVNLMTPVQPMLAEACKSVDQALKKCPNGMYAEIKYDGERVQVHKKGSDFQYFSRSLKPVLDHKINHFKKYIPEAFPTASDLILDSEVLLIDTKTSKPLPFGTLGIHKKLAFKDANVCLFVFDCLHYNGRNLMDKPVKERRKFLTENMIEIPERIMFSEMKYIKDKVDLADLMLRVFREGLEGLVLKDVNGFYEPGMRHWLKVKKDYLIEGGMADTADLVVLGAYFGTGSKGGMKSVFLMGSHDLSKKCWCTVTKCGSGLDDKTLKSLQKSIDMVKINKDYNLVPSWLRVHRTLVPDFVVREPKNSVVWEIMGTEFTVSDTQTSGFSIRFPRILKFRDDKSWKDATDVSRLKLLYEKSKEHSKIEDIFSSKNKKRASKLDVLRDEMMGQEEDDDDDIIEHIKEGSDKIKTQTGNKMGEISETIRIGKRVNNSLNEKEGLKKFFPQSPSHKKLKTSEANICEADKKNIRDDSIKQNLKGKHYKTELINENNVLNSNINKQKDHDNDNDNSIEIPVTHQGTKINKDVVFKSTTKNDGKTINEKGTVSNIDDTIKKINNRTEFKNKTAPVSIKRKLDRDMKNQEDRRPLCKYGSSCYQKSFLHKVSYFHPKIIKTDEEGDANSVKEEEDINAKNVSDDDDKKKDLPRRNNEGSSSSRDQHISVENSSFKNLPNLFTGKMFFLPSAEFTAGEIAKMKRYIITFDGAIYNEFLPPGPMEYDEFYYITSRGYGNDEDNDPDRIEQFRIDTAAKLSDLGIIIAGGECNFVGVDWLKMNISGE